MDLQDKKLVIKYGELVLKKGHRSTFVQNLFFNIKRALKEFELNYQLNYDYLLIENLKNDNFDQIIGILKEIPGINKILVAYLYKKDIGLDNLYSEINKIIKNKTKTFRVTIKRKDKNFIYNSMEFAKLVATNILKNNNLIVNLENYDQEIYLEIHKNHFLLINDEIKGIGGLPVTKANRTLALLSGGIDSPVASKLMLKKGFHLDFVTFVSPPFTSKEAKEKTIQLAKKITLNNKLCNSKLFIINYTSLQNEIEHISNKSYKINLMRRSFFRIANKLCNYLKSRTITTGESLGQVASQTLSSMSTISQAMNENIMIFRPLLCFDKEEIIHLAKKYDTYDISIQPFPDSCSIFAPKNPVTAPILQESLNLEKEIPLLVGLENEVSKKENMEIINLCK